MSPRLWGGGGGGGKLIIVGLLLETTCTHLLHNLQYTFHPFSQTSLHNQVACGHFYSLGWGVGGAVCMLGGRCVLGGEVASLCVGGDNVCVGGDGESVCVGEGERMLGVGGGGE